MERVGVCLAERVLRWPPGGARGSRWTATAHIHSLPTARAGTRQRGLRPLWASVSFSGACRFHSLSLYKMMIVMLPWRVQPC